MFFDAPTDGAGGAPATTPVPAPAVSTGMITQDKMNSLLADQKRETKLKVKTLTDDLKAQTEIAGTSEAEKAVLLERIAELNRTVESDEETSKRTQDELTKKLSTTQKDLSSERDSWKKKFFDAEIGREMIAVATEAGAINAQQIVDLVQHKIQIDIAEDGSHKFRIGEGENAKDIKGHIEAMRENVEQYGNLFRSDKVSGQGSTNGDSLASNPGFANMSVDQIIAERAKKQGY